MTNGRFGQADFQLTNIQQMLPPLTQTLRDLMGEQEIETLETDGKLSVAEQRQRKLEEDMRREVEQRKRKRREQLQRELEYEQVSKGTVKGSGRAMTNLSIKNPSSCMYGGNDRLSMCGILDYSFL